MTSLALLLALPLCSALASAATLPTLGVDPRLIEQYRQQAERGDAQSQLSMGYLYAQGLGVARDLAAAVDWYRKAALQGNGLAQMALGRAHQDGLGVAADPAEAARWYQRVVDQGYTDANARLGALYEAGQGVDKDAQRAASLFRAAAADGNLRAQTALGVMLYEGRGIAADPQQGRALIEQAAAQGLDAARKVLAGYGLPLPAAPGRAGAAAVAQPTPALRPGSTLPPRAAQNPPSAEDDRVFSQAPKVFGIAFDARLRLPPCSGDAERTRQTCFTSLNPYIPDNVNDPVRMLRVYFSPESKPGWIVEQQGHLTLTLVNGLVGAMSWSTKRMRISLSAESDSLVNSTAQRAALTERFGAPNPDGVHVTLDPSNGTELRREGLLWSGDGLLAGEGWVESPAHAQRLRAIVNREIENKLKQGRKL